MVGRRGPSMHNEVPTSILEPASPEGGAGRRRTARLFLAVAVVAGFFLAGLGVAFARTSSTHSARLLAAPATTPPQATTPATPDPNVPGNIAPGHGRRFGHGGRFGGGLFGFGGHGFGFGKFGGLHGEFTVKKPDGSGYETVATQTGEVTAVSPSSITVKSEDGFSRTYSVDENTVVGSGRDGIGSVKTGDTVHVAGLVDGGKASAAAVVDSTGLG